MDNRKLIAGNWKMNGSLASLSELEAIEAAAQDGVDVALCVPATLIAAAAQRAKRVEIGAQDVHWRDCGAHTGCVSAAMLVEAGAKLVIVGHSERRTDQRESDMEVRDKAQAAIAAGLKPIVCVGETLEEREAGQAEGVVRRQLDGSLPDAFERGVIAYEPVWAIGTGKTPTGGDVATMHAAIRAKVGPNVRILYGGSVKASNAVELLHLPNVDGALVGGASLSAADFVPIIAAAMARR